MAVIDTLLPIFAQTVLPVFLVAGAGFVLATFVQIDGRSLGRMLFYLATPALVFRSLYQTELDARALQHLVLVAVSAAVLTGALGWLVSRGQDRKTRAAVVLTSAVSNNGNMGIPISYFAFGDAGAALATVYYVIMSFMSNTFGAAVASAGQTSLRAALQQSLRVPVLYAATAGLLLNAANVAAPVTLMRSIDLLADAAIPAMLVLLGIQLRAAPLVRARELILQSMALRLFASPGIAWAICLLLGVSGVERNVLVLQAAMPSAVMTAVLATEFDAAPELVATIIFFSTAVSMVTLSFVLWLLL
jgi:malate permease and related proteins